MTYNSFAEYLKSLPPDTIFRLWQYKRMFTPYEQEEKFSDESQYVNVECDFVKILTQLICPTVICSWRPHTPTVTASTSAITNSAKSRLARAKEIWRKNNGHTYNSRKD